MKKLKSEILSGICGSGPSQQDCLIVGGIATIVIFINPAAGLIALGSTVIACSEGEY